MKSLPAEIEKGFLFPITHWQGTAQEYNEFRGRVGAVGKYEDTEDKGVAAG